MLAGGPLTALDHAVLAIGDGYGSSWDSGGHSGTLGSCGPSESVVRGLGIVFLS